MSAYYNEIDPFAAQWLRNLIQAGLIAKGEVDERSIVDVQPEDVRGFDQCHFFAGIGVWSHALRNSGWPDDQSVWTGSCPCQPFSVAGKSGGFADERHLWPEFFRLIAECGPPVVFGEQVASKDGLSWLDLVLTDLEGAGYAAGSADLCAAGVGAPHIRQRLYFVADSERGAAERHGYNVGGPPSEVESRAQERQRFRNDVGDGEPIGDGSVEDATCFSCQRERGHDWPILHHEEAEGLGIRRVVGGFWGNADFIWCRDEKYRPVEPGTFPLANRPSSPVGRLRAYGNAIVAPLAEEFIRAYCDAA